MERIFAQIRDTAAREAEQVVQRAHRVADREKEHAREDAARQIAAHHDALERELKQAEERANARIAVDVRREELAQSQEFIEKLFIAARERLRSLPRDARYKAWLASVLTRALAGAGNVSPVVSCNAQDEALVKELLAGAGATLAAEPAPIACGVVVRSADGRLAIDCSGEAELERARDEWRDDLLRQLHVTDAAPGA